MSVIIPIFHTRKPGHRIVKKLVQDAPTGHLPGVLFSMCQITQGVPGLRAAAAAKSLQSCPTLCDPIDDSPPGSPISGILQERTLEWVAISFSKAWKWKVKVKSQSCPTLSDPMDCSLPGSTNIVNKKYKAEQTLSGELLCYRKYVSDFWSDLHFNHWIEERDFCIY